MTTEFLEGDLIEARKGKTVIVGDLRPALGSFWIGETVHTTHIAQRDGFTLTLIERPKPKVEIPTEPGFYSVADTDSPSGHIVIELLNSPAATWVDSSDSRYLETSWIESRGSFTRLESRADTAKAVIERIQRTVQECDRVMHDGLATRSHLREVLQNLAAEFGVTDA